MKPRTSRKEVQKCIGVVKYYLSVWTRRSHTFAHLTRKASNKRKFGLTKVKQDAFENYKRNVARNNLSTYPDFIEAFKIHTNASAFQFGAFIIQKGKPIEFIV